VPDELIDLHSLNPGENMVPVGKDEGPHAKIDERGKNKGNGKTSENDSIVESSQGRNGSIVQCSPEIAEPLEVDKKKISYAVEEGVHEKGDQGGEREREKRRTQIDIQNKKDEPDKKNLKIEMGGQTRDRPKGKPARDLGGSLACPQDFQEFCEKLEEEH